MGNLLFTFWVKHSFISGLFSVFSLLLSSVKTFSVWGDCIPDIVGTKRTGLSFYTCVVFYTLYTLSIYLYYIYQLYIPFAKKNWVLDNLCFLFLSLCKERRSVRFKLIMPKTRKKSSRLSKDCAEEYIICVIYLIIALCVIYATGPCFFVFFASFHTIERHGGRTPYFCSQKGARCVALRRPCTPACVQSCDPCLV